MEVNTTTEMQLNVLRKVDPTVTQFLFVSTFCSIFENDEATSQWMPMDYEGSLYVVETYNQSKPHLGKRFKFILLNRKQKKDFVESFDDRTEFKQNQSYVFYKNSHAPDAEVESPENANNLLPSSLRVIFFSSLEEKEQFWNIVTNTIQP